MKPKKIQNWLSEQPLGDRARVLSEHGVHRTRLLLSLLGDPQRDYKIIIIGGSSGKGSTAKLIADVLTNTGYCTGLFLSPDMLEKRHSVTVNGEPVREATWLTELTRIQRLIEANREEFRDGVPSQFEIKVALACILFSRRECDYAIVEVGLGGRYDAVNSLVSLLAVITNIQLDHEDILGNGLEEIANHKAGIIKNAEYAILGRVERELLPIFQRQADKSNVPLYETKIRCEIDESTIYIRGSGIWDMSFQLPFSAMVPENIALAFSVLELLQAKSGIKIDRDKLCESLSRNNLLGRCDFFQHRSRSDNMVSPETEELICFDGAHTVERLGMLYDILCRLGLHPNKIIIGMIQTKKWQRFIDFAFEKWQNSEYYFCDFQPHTDHPIRSLTSGEMGSYLESKYGKSNKCFDSASYLKGRGDRLISISRLDEDIATRFDKQITLITGSFYLSNAILADREIFPD